MAIGTAIKTDDGYPILEGKDSSSGLVAAITGTLISGHETLDVNSTPMIGGLALSATNPIPILDGYQNPTTTSWTSATALNSTFSCSTAGYDTVIATIVPTGTITAGQIIFEVYDGATWLPIKAPRIESYYTDQGYSLIGSPAGSRGWQIPLSGFPNFRIRLSTPIVGAGSVAVTLITSSAPDTSLVTIGIDPGSLQIGDLPNMPISGGSQSLTLALTGAQTANAPVPITAGGVGGNNLAGQNYIDTAGYSSVSITVAGVGAGVVNILCLQSNTVSGGVLTNQAALAMQGAASTTALPGNTIGTGTTYSTNCLARYVAFQINGGAQTSGTTTLNVTLKSTSGSPVTQYTYTYLAGGLNASATQSGTLAYSNTALSSTAVAVKASAGNWYGGELFNPAAAVTYLQIWNLALGSVTVGTTPPTRVVGIPAGGSLPLSKVVPWSFSAAFTIAATTTPTGSTAPATALVVAIDYD